MTTRVPVGPVGPDKQKAVDVTRTPSPKETQTMIDQRRNAMRGVIEDPVSKEHHELQMEELERREVIALGNDFEIRFDTTDFRKKEKELGKDNALRFGAHVTLSIVHKGTKSTQKLGAKPEMARRWQYIIGRDQKRYSAGAIDQVLSKAMKVAEKDQRLVGSRDDKPNLPETSDIAFEALRTIYTDLPQLKA